MKLHGQAKTDYTQAPFMLASNTSGNKKYFKKGLLLNECMMNIKLWCYISINIYVTSTIRCQTAGKK